MQINNWSFFIDGERVWTTRHEGVFVANPLGTLLLGRRHGEHWGSGRMWRSGVGDSTCLQANLCNFAFYPTALLPAIIRKNFEFNPSMRDVPAPLAATQAAKPGTGGSGVGEGQTDPALANVSASLERVQQGQLVIGGGSKIAVERSLIDRSKFSALKHRYAHTESSESSLFAMVSYLGLHFMHVILFGPPRQF